MTTANARSMIAANPKAHSATASIPAQRDGDSEGATSAKTPSCSLCGATDTPLEPDRKYSDQLRCAVDLANYSVREACFNKIRPRCPQWCIENHIGDDFQAVDEGVWYHASDLIEVVFTETYPNSKRTESVALHISAFENVGGDMEAAQISMGDTIMLPSQAESFASALKAAAQIARIPSPTRD